MRLERWVMADIDRHDSRCKDNDGDDHDDGVGNIPGDIELSGRSQNSNHEMEKTTGSSQ